MLGKMLGEALRTKKLIRLYRRLSQREPFSISCLTFRVKKVSILLERNNSFAQIFLFN